MKSPPSPKSSVRSNGVDDVVFVGYEGVEFWGDPFDPPGGYGDDDDDDGYTVEFGDGPPAGERDDRSVAAMRC